MFSPIGWGIKKIADAFYALKVAINAKLRKRFPKKPSTLKRDKIFDYIFYFSLMAIPLVMFIIVNFVIDGQAILLGFQEYDLNDKFTSMGFENFRKLFSDLGQPKFKKMFELSAIAWTASTVICNIIPITFSFYVYKKFLGHNVFKILLYLPTLFSSMITISLFRNICNSVIPELFGTMPLLDTSNPNSLFGTLLFYNLWSGLGGGLLMHLAVMNAIDPSITESAQLDGVGFYGELWHIVLPSCYRVLTLGLVTSVAGIFGGSLNLFALVGKATPTEATLPGHYFYVQTLDAKLNSEYAYLSSWGLFVTAICTPVTLFLRHLVNKYGPSEE